MKCLSLFTLVMAAFFTFAVFSSSTEEQLSTTADTSIVNGNLPQTVLAIDLEGPFDFAGEVLPVDNFDVRERLDRELLRNAYWHSNTLLNLKKAYRYFPLIERILKEEEVPDDFKYLAVAESDLRNAVSPAGARGFWQFMKATAKEYKLEINSEVDERYHLEKATKAACKMLKAYKKRFGSWTLAAAAYNVGSTRLGKELKVQRATSYYDMNLNAETARYIFRIVALKEILAQPDLFGFRLSNDDKYSPLDSFYTVEVKEAVPNWGDFAQKYGISYRMLKLYNPWLINTSLTNRYKKTYEIKIPKKE